MDLRKYMTDLGGPHTIHRGWLYWAHPNQLPLRYQDHEVGTIRTPGPLAETFEYYCDAFDIMDPVQRTNYQWVIDRILSGWYNLKHHRHLDGVNSTKIWLEWIQRYRIPAGGKDG